MSSIKPMKFNLPGPADTRTEEERQNDIKVQVRFKDEPEDVWHEGSFTEDHLLYVDGHEVIRLDLYLKTPDGELIDMEEEYNNYRQEKFKELLHLQARYLAKQYFANQERIKKGQ